jgi:hypothetical protein
MATTEQITELRDLVNDTVAPFQFSAPQLGTFIDTNDSLRAAASRVWTVKASKLAGLVDVTEGSSSRKLSQLYQQALEMSTFYNDDPSTASRVGKSGTRAIVRP